MKIIILLILLFFAAGCSSTKEEYMNKMDMSLKMEVKNALENDSEKNIRFLGKADSAINSDLEREIEDAGIKIENVMNKIFTASGSAEQILNLASKKFITRLEKSGENKLFN